MGTPGSASETSKQDVLRVFSQSNQPYVRLATSEVAGELDCPPGTVQPPLEELVEQGHLHHRKLDESTHLWWPTGLDEGDAPTGHERFRHEQFGAFINAVRDYAIFRLDPDGTVASWNQGAERIKGYTESEIIGEHFSTFYTQTDVEEGVPERNLQAAADAGSVEDEGWRVRGDGSRFWANVTITAIRDDDGDLRGYTKVTRDMTERREYERQLQNQAERLERQRDELEQELDEVFERIDDAFYALDDEFRFTYVNDTAEGYFDKTAGELLGRKAWDELDIGGDDPIIEKYETAMATQEQTSFEHYSEPLGIWTMVRVYPSPSGLSVYFRDITERKEREQELERYETIIEESADVNGILDPDGSLRFVTPTVQHVLGYDPDELLGEDAFGFVHPDDREETRALFEGLINGAADPPQAEFRFRHADGSWVWLEAHGRNLLDDSDIDGLVVYTRDVTDRKRYEERLADTIEALEESNERLERFAYAASHDLQEPLRMISSYLQLIEDRYEGALDEDGQEFLTYALDGAERLREMIGDLLEYSRVDTAAEPLEPTDCEAVVERVRRNLEVQIEETDAQLEVEPLPTVSGDENQLELVFQNLVSNAIKYRSDEPPHIEIGAQRAGDEWVFRVVDNGIGMDPEETDRIFDVFQRLHTNEEYQGTGIGLALCQKIVERHDGRIWVESTPGEGSTFYFTLPTQAKGKGREKQLTDD